MDSRTVSTRESTRAPAIGRVGKRHCDATMRAGGRRFTIAERGAKAAALSSQTILKDAGVGDGSPVRTRNDFTARSDKHTIAGEFREGKPGFVTRRSTLQGGL